MDRNRRIQWALSLALWGLAAGVRLRDTSAVMMLADSVGPWWVALANPLGGGHTPIYGWGLSVPYAVGLWVAGSLVEAVRFMLTVHGLVAPLAFGLVRLLSPKRWAAALAAGLLAALDPGLVDTALSGAEGYLAPAWLGLMTYGVCAGPSRKWSVCAGIGLGFAVMNHPLAICGVPILWARSGGNKAAWLSLGVAAVLCVPHTWSLLGESLTTSGGISVGPIEAVLAFLQQGGRTAGLVLLAPVVGWGCSRTRRLASVLVGSLLLLVLFGAVGGYLRDHHLRMLTVPALGCLAAIPGWWGLMALACLQLPRSNSPPQGNPQRPATVGLTADLADEISGLGLERPVVVQGLWVSGVPAAEPSAIMLDLWLRGWGAAGLGPGGSLVLVVSADRAEMGVVDARIAEVGWEGTVASRGDTYMLVTEGAQALANHLCWLKPRVGGAWDAVAVLHPGTLLGEEVPWHLDCGEAP